MKNIDITFHGLSQEDAQSLLAAIRHDYVGPAPTVAEASAKIASADAAAAPPAEEAPAKAPRGAGKKSTAAKAEPAAEQKPSDSKPVDLDPVSLDEVRSALADLLAAKGMNACAEVLHRFGASRISEVPAKAYADVVAACKAGLA